MNSLAFSGFISFFFSSSLVSSGELGSWGSVFIQLDYPSTVFFTGVSSSMLFSFLQAGAITFRFYLSTPLFLGRVAIVRVFVRLT